MWSGNLWNRKRMRDEGFQAMRLPHKRSSTLFTQQRWSQASKPLGYLNPHLDERPIQEQMPLGLQLKKSQSFLELIQKKLSEDKKSEAKKDLTLPKKQDDKHKASNFAASHIRIGSWEYKTVNAGTGIMAKFYYAKHKLVWEVIHSGLKYKMEIQWSDITALKGNCPENEPGTLALVLGKPPLFFKENDPQPKKHTLWHRSKDFTGGQASTYRQHFLEFPQGVLDKHFKKLIQCDSRLGLLSQVQEPVLNTPYFLPIASNQVQFKDGVVGQSEKPGGSSSVYNLHDVALSPSLLISSDIEQQQGSVPLHSPSNVEFSLNLTDDSSNYSQSPLSDTLTSFDYGIPILEPVTESPISTLHDLVCSSTSPSVRQQQGSLCKSLDELSKDVFGPAGGSPYSGVPNVASLSDLNFSNVEEQIPLGVSHQDFSNFEVHLGDLANVEQGISLGLPNHKLSDYEVTFEDLSNAEKGVSSGITNQDLSAFGVTLEDLSNVEQRVSLGIPNQDLSDFEASLEKFSNLEQRVSLGISHQNLSKTAHSPLSASVIGTCGTKVSANSEAQIFQTLEVPSLQPSTSIDDHVGHIDLEELHQVLFSDTTTIPNENSLMSKVNSFSNVLNWDQNSENNHMNSMVSSKGVRDGRVLEPVISCGFMPEIKVQSNNVFHWDQSSGNNPMNRMVNSEGVQDRRVLEPVMSYGFTSENKVQSDDVVAQEKNLNGPTQLQTMSRIDSCFDLLHDLPRIASLSYLLCSNDRP